MSNTLSPGSGWNITAKKADNVIANYRTVQVGTIKYTFTGWDTSFPVRFANLTEDTTVTVTAQYNVEGLPNLSVNYNDNVANGSSAWASNNSFESYTHTFKTPADIPEHYEFLYWEGNGSTYTAGAQFSVNVAQLSGDTTIDFVAVYKYQPAVQVNYHYKENTVSVLEYQDIDIYGSAPIEGKWFYSGESTPIAEGTKATLPEKVVTTVAMNEVKEVDVYAKYFKVTWVNDDGAVLKEDVDVPYGATPEYTGNTPTKKATAQYTYTFKAWTPEIVAVTADATYKATYTAKAKEQPTQLYTITYMPGDHGLFQPQATTLPYGSATPPAPAVIGEEGYQFTGWSPAIGGVVTGNAVFTAQWEKIPVAPTPTPTPTEEVIKVRLVEDIDDDEAPLAAPETWALLNLICLVATIFTLVKYKKKYNIITPIAVLAALGLFIFTENVHNPMVIVDKWTAWQLLICVIGVVSRLIAKNEEEKQEEVVE
jgi:hypothetical protein